MSYDPCPEGGDGVIDLGHGVRIRFTGRHGLPDDVRTGLIESHDRPDGEGRCSGGITFDMPETEDMGGAKWTVFSMDPLDLGTEAGQSLLCRTCGHHGFIHNGAWVPV